MKKILIISLSLLLLLTLFTGCGAGTEADYAYTESPKDFAEDAMSETVVLNNGSFTADSSATSVTTNRKLIRKLHLEVETETYDELFANVQQMVAQCGGYVESMDANTRYGSTSRYATMVIRVPADQLDHFAADVAEASNVVYRSESTNDVTLSYVDMESRKAALLVEQERLMALLEQAGSLEEILQIETRLTEVRYELESIESQLRTYDNLVDYATIHLELQEVVEYTEPAPESGWARMGKGFLESLKGLGNGLKEFFIFLVISIPYLIFFAAVVTVIVLVIRRIRKKRRKAKEIQQ